jgi:hypothetical protein
MPARQKEDVLVNLGAPAWPADWTGQAAHGLNYNGVATVPNHHQIKAVQVQVGGVWQAIPIGAAKVTAMDAALVTVQMADLSAWGVLPTLARVLVHVTRVYTTTGDHLAAAIPGDPPAPFFPAAAPAGGMSVYDITALDWLLDAVAGGGTWDFLVDGPVSPSGWNYSVGGALTVNQFEIGAAGNLQADLQRVGADGTVRLEKDFTAEITTDPAFWASSMVGGALDATGTSAINVIYFDIEQSKPVAGGSQVSYMSRAGGTFRYGIVGDGRDDFTAGANWFKALEFLSGLSPLAAKLYTDTSGAWDVDHIHNPADHGCFHPGAVEYTIALNFSVTLAAGSILMDMTQLWAELN